MNYLNNTRTGPTGHSGRRSHPWIRSTSIHKVQLFQQQKIGPSDDLQMGWISFQLCPVMVWSAPILRNTDRTILWPPNLSEKCYISFKSRKSPTSCAEKVWVHSVSGCLDQFWGVSWTCLSSLNAQIRCAPYSLDDIVVGTLWHSQLALSRYFSSQVTISDRNAASPRTCRVSA